MASKLRIAGMCAALAATSNAHAGPVTLAEQSDHVTTASVVVDATPAEIYALVTDYANWRAVFSDIESVTVKAGGREDATVQFRSRAIGYRVTVRFDNTRDRIIRFRGIAGPPGGRSHGTYALVPLPGGRTRIDASLYMDVVGAPGLVIRESQIRPKRRAKLRADLEDVRRRFTGAS